MQESSRETKLSNLIQTKLVHPRLRGDLLVRPHLLGRLECSEERKFTLISAPAGYGKTTLMAQWLDTCSTPTAWISLDAGESDIGPFVSYAVAAIRTAYPTSCTGTWQLLHALYPAPIDNLVSALANDLEALPSSLILAMDDYHTIRDASVHQLMAQLIQYLPNQVHLAVASRTDPPFALDRLRAGRQILEVRAQDLRFSEQETQSYLELELERSTDPEIAALLASRTEGWIAGLHLATLWLRGMDNPAEALAGLGGDTAQFVAEYLASEVLSHQPASVRQFLLRTSILDRFCADLCDVMLELSPGSASALPDELKRANLFLISLGEEGGWYRYHQLFREMLRAALHSQVSEDEISALHCRASDWFEAQDLVEEALQHSLAAGDVQSAVRIVQENAHNLLNHLERQALERWLSLLPPEAVWQQPQLLIAQAWLLYRQARIAAIDGILDAAESCLDDPRGGPLARDQRPMWGQIYALRTAMAFTNHDEFRKSQDLAERALECLPITERGARSTALVFSSLAKQALGEKEAAVRSLEQALGDAPTRGLAPPQLYHGLSLVHYLSGDLHQMLGATQRNLAYAAEMNHVNAVTGANWLSGLLHYEWNDQAAATAHFLEVLNWRYAAQFLTTSTCMLGLARILQIQGELEKAQEMIDGLRAETLRLDNTSLLPPVDSIQAGQWLQQGDVARALRWARSFNPQRLAEPFLWFESPGLTQARIIIAAGTKKRSGLREIRFRTS